MADEARFVFVDLPEGQRHDKAAVMQRALWISTQAEMQGAVLLNFAHNISLEVDRAGAPVEGGKSQHFVTLEFDRAIARNRLNIS